MAEVRQSLERGENAGAAPKSTKRERENPFTHRDSRLRKQALKELILANKHKERIG
jgi:hypothetical protein